jgi:hypothetical protein
MSSICKGVTKKNLPCLKKTKNKNDFCSFHEKEKQCLYECYICNENNVKEALSCNHYICSGCIGKLRNFTCPICKEELSGKVVTTDLEKKIKKNENEDEMERIKNNVNLLATMRQQMQRLAPNVYVKNRNNGDIEMYVDEKLMLITSDSIKLK